MIYRVIASKRFVKEKDRLSIESQFLLREKINILKKDPYRYKRLKGFDAFLFRIRFSDRRKAKRLVYLVKKTTIFLVCILDRKKDYKDLEIYIKSLEHDI